MSSSNNNQQDESNPSNEPDSDQFQPWYHDLRNIVATNERRPGRMSKSEKRRHLESMLPIYQNPEQFKDELPGGQFYMTPEQRRAEYMDMIKAEKEAAEKERQEKMKHAICEGQGTSSGYGNGLGCGRGGQIQASASTSNDGFDNVGMGRGNALPIRNSCQPDYGPRRRGRADYYKCLKGPGQ